MRFARVSTPFGPRYAVQRSERWAFIETPFVSNFANASLSGSDLAIGSSHFSGEGNSISVADAILLAPVEPMVVVGMARNGFPEQRTQLPAAFLKSARTIADPGGHITVDPGLGETIIEGELAIVIGAPASHLTEQNALEAVFGYTIANDVTVTSQVPLDPLMTQAKSGLGFTPIGPVIDTDIDPFDARISIMVNGVEVAAASTAQLARNVVELLVYVTRFVALDVGDVILTGCPGTAHPVGPGDDITVMIEGLGSLSSAVVC